MRFFRHRQWNGTPNSGVAISSTDCWHQAHQIELMASSVPPAYSACSTRRGTRCTASPPGGYPFPSDDAGRPISRTRAARTTCTSCDAACSRRASGCSTTTPARELLADGGTVAGAAGIHPQRGRPTLPACDTEGQGKPQRCPRLGAKHSSQTVGLMFGFIRKKFRGSYLFFRATSRS